MDARVSSLEAERKSSRRSRDGRRSLDLMATNLSH
jgi:hypothetical protein